MRAMLVASLLGVALAAPCAAAPGPDETPFTRALAFDAPEPAPGPLALAGDPMIPPLTLATGSITAPRDPAKEKPKKHGKKPQTTNDSNEGLGPERARILLRSLTVPGWGQATLGLNTSAKVFMVIEAGIWGSFVAFRIQEATRTDAYLKTARLAAGIDLSQQDDEFRRIVGAFASNEEYNLLVVTRDAANIYLSDPNHQDLVGYRAYIAEHSLSGSMAWNWTDEASFDRYGGQRKDAQRAGLRSNTALALAVANRIVSALHAARAAGKLHAQKSQSWRLDVTPDGTDPKGFRAALTTRF